MLLCSIFPNFEKEALCCSDSHGTQSGSEPHGTEQNQWVDGICNPSDPAATWDWEKHWWNRLSLTRYSWTQGLFWWVVNYCPCPDKTRLSNKYSEWFVRVALQHRHHTLVQERVCRILSQRSSSYCLVPTWQHTVTDASTIYRRLRAYCILRHRIKFIC